MKNVLVAVLLSFMALGLVAGNAEAARMGGGKSIGTQRQSVAPKPATPAQQATAAAPTAPSAAPAAAPKRNWMGPLAGLAAGLGIAALLSHFGMGEGMGNILMIALLAMAAVFVVKMLLRRKASATPADNSSLQYAGAAHAPAPATVHSAPQYSGSTPAAITPARIPAGFDSQAFVRVAKLNFVRLQASNDTRNIEDIRQFTSPELFAEIKMQMNERGDAPQQTDVVRLDAELLEVSTEGNRHIASVHFSGLIRETSDVAATPFDEVWNLAKEVDGNTGWTVVGIQQLN